MFLVSHAYVTLKLQKILEIVANKICVLSVGDKFYSSRTRSFPLSISETSKFNILTVLEKLQQDALVSWTDPLVRVQELSTMNGYSLRDLEAFVTWEIRFR